jgi:soluble lytic murein transglycosylase-like protein
VATLERVRSKLTTEEWRYVGAGALGFVGLVAWAIGFRTLRYAPPLLGEFGDRDCPEAVYAQVLGQPLSSGNPRLDSKSIHRAWYYAPTIVASAIHFGVPPDVLVGMAHTESRFTPDARSSRGAVGLIQFMPNTAKAFHERLLESGEWPFLELDREDPVQSAWLAGAYMRHLLQRRDLEHAIAGYNAGEARVKPDTPKSEWPPETRNYVPGVLRRAGYYREIWERCGLARTL